MKAHISKYLIAFILTSTGCALNSQQLVLSPVIQATSLSSAHGKNLAINVLDERPKLLVGNRGLAGAGGDITVRGDLATIVRDSLMNGIMAIGFTPTTQSERVLQVEIRALDYYISQGLLANHLKVTSALKAICKIGSSSKYEQLYRGEHEETLQIYAGTDENNEYVTDALTQSLRQVINDQQLLACLSGN